MDFKKKIEKICSDRNLTQKEFAELIGVNHIVLNRNLSKGNVTSDTIEGIASNLPEVDLNWLFKDEELLTVNEPTIPYGDKSNTVKELDKALSIIKALKEKLEKK